MREEQQQHPWLIDFGWNFVRTRLRAWLNGNGMFYETFICFYVSEAKPLCFSFCLQMFDDVERMFVTQMSNYFFVISFQLMFCKTLRYHLARA